MAHVIVVGAGPAGAALAFLLARRGIRVTLIERQTDFAREFRGEVLMPSGIDMLRQMGLGEAFDAVPQVRPEKLDFHVHGRLVRRVELPDFVRAGPRMVSQPHMLEMLVEQGAAYEGFELIRGGTVVDLVMEADRCVGVRLRGRDEPILTDLVVGGDGRTSSVRKRAGLEADADLESFDVVWFKVAPPAHLRDDPAVQVFLRPGQFCLAIPTFDGRLQVGWVIQKGRYGDLKQRGSEAWLSDLSQSVGSVLAEHLMQQRDALGHPFVLDVQCYSLEQWHAAGVVLIGDSAHPMSPVGGQGLNIALRDAVVLANHLVPTLTGSFSPADVDRCCAAMQAERYPEVVEVERLQRIPPRFFFQGGVLASVVLSALSLLLRSPIGRGGVRPPPIATTFLDGVTEVELRV